MGRKTQPLLILGMVLSVMGLVTAGIGAQRMIRGNSDVVEVAARVASARPVMTSMAVGARGARRDIEQREIQLTYLLDGAETHGTSRMGPSQQAQHFPVGAEVRAWIERPSPQVVLLKPPSPFFAFFLLGIGALLFICGGGFALISTLTKG